mmetsp:Transcript_28763/g.43907  ORF Transcript_28763/g.43907 Transcript_28763/m.43907 type:complete len:1047 (+) Transcript_28763:132-3272(+)
MVTDQHLVDRPHDESNSSSSQPLSKLSYRTHILSSTCSCETYDDSLYGFDNENAPLIVGRSDEFLALKNAYDRVKNSHSFERVVVHGESGTGKTSFVMKLQESVILDNGFFCVGKYFQNSEVKQDPYSAIMTAFSDLCDLMLQSDNFNEERRRAIEESLGSDGISLINAVTNISPFLGDRVKFDNCTHRSFSFARFKVACKRFIRAMSSDDSPIVFFIDDIQWMDNGSKDLLKVLLEDTQLRNVMLILTYRDEDACRVEDIFSSKTAVSLGVKLDKLDLKSVYQILADRLGATANSDIPFEQEALCKLISHKANGNPFYIINILESLIEDGLLLFDEKTSSWVCDFDVIQANTMIPDSLADLISHKTQRLGKNMTEILKMASLLGYRFKHELIYELAILNEADKEEKEDDISLPEILESAIKSRIIEETHDGYQFTHDKLQAAFCSILDATEKEKLHLQIGKHLLTKEGIGYKYLAAIHLNQCGMRNFGTTEDRILLAKTNLRASKYCDSRNAFMDAAALLRKGLAVLGDGEEKWSTNFDLAFEMTEFLARLEFTIGNMDACTSANDDILQRATTKKSRINALSLEIDIQIAINDIISIKRTGKKALRELGIKMPLILTPSHLLRKLMRVRKLLDSIDDESIYNLRLVDSDLPDVCKLIHLLGFYFVQQDKLLWAFYTALLGTEYTLRHGLSKYSAVLFNLYGICEMYGMRNRSRGYRLGRVALELSSRLPCQHAARIFSIFQLLFNQQRVRMGSLSNFTLDNLNDGLEDGDFAFMLLPGSISFLMRFWAGENILVLEKSVRVIYERLSELGQTGLLMYFQPMLQLFLNLGNDDEDDWEELIVLTGEVMNELEYRNLLLASSPSPVMLLVFLLAKMMLAYYLGFNDVAVLISLEMQQKRFEPVNQSYACLPLNFYKAMVFCARYRETGHRKHLRHIRNCKKVLKYHHSSGNPNAEPFLRVVEAEEFSLKAQTLSEICEIFDCAIDLSAKEGIGHLEALANERASCVLLNSNALEASKRYLESAKHACREKWGATMMYRWLCHRYNF